MKIIPNEAFVGHGSKGKGQACIGVILEGSCRCTTGQRVREIGKKIAVVEKDAQVLYRVRFIKQEIIKVRTYGSFRRGQDETSSAGLEAFPQYSSLPGLIKIEQIQEIFGGLRKHVGIRGKKFGGSNKVKQRKEDDG